MIAFAWLAFGARRRGQALALETLARAVFSRRVLLHRSTFADLAYCVISLATLGAILGSAVVSASWISDGVAAFLTSRLGPPPRRTRPKSSLERGAHARALSRLTTSASFSTTRLSTASRRYGSFIRRTTRPKC